MTWLRAICSNKFVFNGDIGNLEKLPEEIKANIPTIGELKKV